MSSPASASELLQGDRPTIWGLTPAQVHDRYWAARGVQVVRRGEHSEIVDSAELFLLIEPSSLVVFQLRDLVEMLSWLKPRLALLRIRDEGQNEYREVVRSDEDGRLLEFARIYDGLDSHLARGGLTPHPEIARVWQDATSSSDGWRKLRDMVPEDALQARSVSGRVFDATRGEELMAHLEYLVARWPQPGSTISRAKRASGHVWMDRDAQCAPQASVVGPVWVGSGRQITSADVVVGPAILWDDPHQRPRGDEVAWLELEPTASGDVATNRAHVLPARQPFGKRLFDVLFSLVLLAFTLPLYPFIALAILLEDGWPIFFAHGRETLGGREFPCLKFRSMRRDAEKIKMELQEDNVSDGPQFFVEKDPRSTRVGRFLRATQMDELPQFLNVLMGHMSVVGPRPSPRRENQFCPAWREARLSVRPGITGLWQIRRTRAEGLDFQEWIRYDLEYVERMSWRLDLWILWKTLAVVLRRGA